MKTLRNFVLVLLVLYLAGAVSALLPVHAQTLEVRALLSDQGWHGVGGGVQVHQPTLEFRAPWLAAWERSARNTAQGAGYGEWTYVKVMINCQQWSHIPIATLDSDDNVVFLDELTGVAPAARWPDPGTVPYRTMTALCGLYGYTRQALPRLIANPDGSPFVGGIQRVDKP